MEQNPTQRLAQTLFFQSDKTQKEIAQLVGVSEKTIYLWMKQGDWKRLRSASKLMPSMIVDNFLSQVQELNDEIRTRDQGRRYPTVQEAETFRKMVVTIGRIQKGHTQGEYMEMMQKFLTYLLPRNQELVVTLSYYADDFLKSRGTEGFLPFDTAYQPEEPIEVEGETEIPPLKGDVPRSTNVDAERGDIQPGPATQPNIYPALASLRGMKQPRQNADELAKDNIAPVIKSEKTVMTRNCVLTPYDAPVKPFSETPQQKAETENETETGNSAPPNEHIPGLTWRTPEGELKLIPPYQSKEYYDIPLYLRERLYDMSGQPINDRIISRYF